MADFSALTHKFRANLDNSFPGASKVSKRNRQPLSCAPCRVKKLKCDRGHPCETCVKRGDSVGCTYGKIPARAPSPALAPASTASFSIPDHRSHVNTAKDHGKTNSGSSRDKAQERLRHLEQLVMQMVDSTSPTTSPSRPTNSDMHIAACTGTSDVSSDVAPAGSSIAREGHLQYGSSESRYVGSTHWSAILQNIQELKTVLGSSSQHASSTELDESDDAEPLDAENLFGSAGNLSLAQILKNALPPRLLVDRRLSTYFNSRYAVIPLIHAAHFQSQYEQFWRTPLETDPLWVSIMFSVCCMSATLSEAVGSEPSTREDQISPRMAFLTASCQCLRLGGFLRPKRHVVEALALYSQCKYMATLDPSREVGVVFAILVRQAYRSGYHRDPTQFPHFSVFEGEMRRRTWAMLRQFDLMISFQLGLPNQVPPDSWDTQPPRNLLDTDFDESTTVLPPSRPEAEATPLLYFIVKSRLMTSFGKVCAQALSFREVSQAEIMALDAEVRAVHKTVPAVLHIKPMARSFADPSYLIMVRLNCEFLYQKSLCVLHRKYMAQGGYPASTAACTDAAVAITKHMLDLHKEFKPGGQLYADRWMLSSFTMNDFYLASMVLCLGVSMWKKANPRKDVSEDDEMKSQYSLLQSAFGICEDLSPTSTEAKRLAGVLRVVLNQIGSTGRGEIPASNKASMPRESGPAAESVVGNLPSTQDPSKTSRLPPFLHGTTRYGAPIFFPLSYDFNLDPLSLNEQSVSTSSSSVPLPIQDGNQVDGGSNPDIWPTQHGVPEQDSSRQLGPNPFTAFLPFSPQHGSQIQNMGPLDPNLAGTSGMNNDASSLPANPHPNTNPNMDIDWAFLDQWVALPNPDEMVLTEDHVPVYPSSTLPPPAADSDNLGSAADSSSTSASASASTGFGAQDWTSTPYRFLGIPSQPVPPQTYPSSRPPNTNGIMMDTDTEGTQETDGSTSHSTNPSTSYIDAAAGLAMLGGRSDQETDAHQANNTDRSTNGAAIFNGFGQGHMSTY